MEINGILYPHLIILSIKSGAPRSCQCPIYVNNFPLTETCGRSAETLKGTIPSNSKFSLSNKDTSGQTSAKSRWEILEELSNIPFPSSCSHLLPDKLPLYPERLIWGHFDLQWPNLPQAKQLPFLDGKEERLNGRRSFWLRQEPNAEKPREFCGPYCKVEVRRAEVERLTDFLEAAEFKAFSAPFFCLVSFLAVRLTVSKFMLGIFLDGPPTKLRFICQQDKLLFVGKQRRTVWE